VSEERLACASGSRRGPRLDYEVSAAYCYFHTRVDRFLLAKFIPRRSWILLMRFAAAFLALLVAGTATAQSPVSPATKAQVRFRVADSQLEPAMYSLVIYENGAGRYTATYTASTNGDSAAPPVDRAIHVRNPVLSQLFATARRHHFFAMECQAPHSHVAFTGNKTLAYAGPDGEGSCTFNYSREEAINQIAASLMSVAYTLQIGATLARDHRYDRLSLDAELGALQEAAKGRQATELENIAPELESIANDDAVMDRARARARALLLEPASAR
jgi:hypothetical protein